jgi:hypothetical protein
MFRVLGSWFEVRWVLFIALGGIRQLVRRTA